MLSRYNCYSSLGLEVVIVLEVEVVEVVEVVEEVVVVVVVVVEVITDSRCSARQDEDTTWGMNRFDKRKQLTQYHYFEYSNTAQNMENEIFTNKVENPCSGVFTVLTKPQ